MSKGRKQLIKRAAKIYAANLVRETKDAPAFCEDITPLEADYFIDQLEMIANGISTVRAATIEDCLAMATKTAPDGNQGEKE